MMCINVCAYNLGFFSDISNGGVPCIVQRFYTQLGAARTMERYSILL